MSYSLYPLLYSNSPRHTFLWWGSVEEFENFLRNLKSSHYFFNALSFACHVSKHCNAGAWQFSKNPLKKSHTRGEGIILLSFLIKSPIIFHAPLFPMVFTIQKETLYSGQQMSTCQYPMAPLWVIPTVPLYVINNTATHGRVANKQSIGHNLVRVLQPCQVVTLTTKVFNLLVRASSTKIYKGLLTPDI